MKTGILVRPHCRQLRDRGKIVQYQNPSVYCPHNLDSTSYDPYAYSLFTDLYFVINDIPNGSVSRAEFINQVLTSCLVYTAHPFAQFVEYGIKSAKDVNAIGELFHRPLFAAVPASADLPFLPFGRIVVFGDSLSDKWECG